jgi:hypothetical protein
MYVMYYMPILWCWHLVRILVRTNHPYLRVACHTLLLGGSGSVQIC